MFDILHRVGIRAPLQVVYAALSTPAGIAGWWTTQTTGDTQVGGRLNFRFSAGGVEIGAFDMQIIELDPDRRVAWQVTSGPPEWLGTTLSFTLRQDKDFTIVLFRHEGWREPVEFMYHCSTKWAVFLMSLKALGEAGKGHPSPDDVRIGDWH
jgi:uncharacterized protein YndB with AHSA1/START domain